MPRIRLNDAIGNPSPQLQALIRWLDAIATENVQDLEDSMSDEFYHQVYPLSLGRSQRNKAEFLAYQQSQLMRIFKNVEFVLDEAVQNSDTVCMRGSSTATSATGHPYANEYAVFAGVTKQPDGRYRVQYVKEFVDSKASIDFFTSEKKRQESLEKSHL
ncbi:hypothetical protein EIP91_004675 [Steccherinum ochraceum]|uniref:SnoaL-like domain-containing protein n=1 Tax=Steccherinum ochraceum TaxID=92696 RepID=A0A4V2MVX8_9APHY|nr:hypothetical protein EIP91_004675 [Steccherinum ochraceum]